MFDRPRHLLLRFFASCFRSLLLMSEVGGYFSAPSKQGGLIHGGYYSLWGRIRARETYGIR
jgi:hypothetical protein